MRELQSQIFSYLKKYSDEEKIPDSYKKLIHQSSVNRLLHQLGDEQISSEKDKNKPVPINQKINFFINSFFILQENIDQVFEENTYFSSQYGIDSKKQLNQQFKQILSDKLGDIVNQQLTKPHLSSDKFEETFEENCFPNQKELEIIISQSADKLTKSNFNLADSKSNHENNLLIMTEAFTTSINHYLSKKERLKGFSQLLIDAKKILATADYSKMSNKINTFDQCCKITNWENMMRDPELTLDDKIQKLNVEFGDKKNRILFEKGKIKYYFNRFILLISLGKVRNLPINSQDIYRKLRNSFLRPKEAMMNTEQGPSEHSHFLRRKRR